MTLRPSKGPRARPSRALAATRAALCEAAFEAAAREGSDQLASRAEGGDLGPRTPEDLASARRQRLQGPAAALQQSGQMTDLVETDRGLRVLYLRGRHPGLTQTLRP
jgi:hypothetical protein